MENDQQELEISESAWKQAVVVIKVLDASDNNGAILKYIYKTSHAYLRNSSHTKQAFGLHLLRFLFKSNRATIGWLAKRRILGLLRSHQSFAVRLAAFDVLGAIMTQTGSRSGVKESDYSDIMVFRKQMLERSRALEAYEKNEATSMAFRLVSDGDLLANVERLFNEVA